MWGSHTSLAVVGASRDLQSFILHSASGQKPDILKAGFLSMNSRFKFWVVSTSTCLVLLLLFGAVHGRSANPDETYRHLSVYTQLLTKIKQDYVQEPYMNG